MPEVGELEGTRRIKDVLPPVEILRLLTGGATNKDTWPQLSVLVRIR